MSRTNWKMKMMAMSKLSEKLGSGKPVVTAACIPPHGTDAAAVKKLAACFRRRSTA